MNDRLLFDNIKAVCARNYPSMVGMFYILYIWASIASAKAHSSAIVVDPGVFGYYGVLAGMVIAAVLHLFLLSANKRQAWLKCETIMPPLCATLLITSRFFFDWRNDLSSFAANLILGFSTLAIVILLFVGVSSEIAGIRSKRILPVAMAAVYIGYSALVFALWPLIGDELADKIGHVLPIVLLFFVIASMSAKMKKFGADEDAAAKSGRATALADLLRASIVKLATEHALSAREQEVLLLLAQGFSAPYIADRLYISNGTVKTHVARIYNKLGVSKRDELIELLQP